MLAKKRRRLGKTRIALDSLGCKLNQAESELLARQFAEAGYRLVSPTDEADVYILNTCTVTHIADSKARHRLRLAHRQNPEALIVATGCYAERAQPELAQIEGVDLVLDNEEKPHLLRLLRESGRLGNPAQVQGDLTSRHYDSFHTRAFIKVQDGCHDFCAYCIVPLVRSREESLPVDQIVDEVRHRLAQGYQEVVLTGVKIGAYSYNGINLKELLEHILTETDVARLRLSSLQPQEISPELIGLWHNRRLCPHFHLSLQSGSNWVLSRMKRHYSTSDYEQSVSLIRSSVPEAAITTDIMVGFPGETDEEFEESYHFCRRMEFARIHVFTYSPRRGTQAAQLPGQVKAEVKKQRSQRMLALAEESTQNFSQRFLCQVMPVLWEKQSPNGTWSGLTANYIKVYAGSSDDLTNKLLPVKLVEIRGDGVWGKAYEIGGYND
ncbi:MAG: tRNA (N(6)-L-threonylcarbamoyladenosine(37)-C(2))-methylthiotransferase MtaB [Dehalococcoidales bacterium]|jgi:threonylcarbamoyladenosine tRNA methylthiotransferase MtaB|nr:tRNA (N(6)-L-threonylcarbamoyladenosine(37)-C(2))-methylthiotransferase MtaB [Dehalococcoidales bacterium]